MENLLTVQVPSGILRKHKIIVSMLVHKKSYEEIGTRLKIKARTVKKHLETLHALFGKGTKLITIVHIFTQLRWI